MKRITLSIDGMTCSACSNGLEKYLNKQNGIYNASVNLVMANATIEYDEKILDEAKLDDCVKRAGFKSLGEFKEINLEKKNGREKILFIVFTILAIALMYIAMGHMLNLPSVPYLDPHENPLNYTFVLIVLTVSFLGYGYDILRNGYKNLVHGVPNMDTLVGIGVITSFLYSIYNVYLIAHGDEGAIMNLYFESSAIVIYFVKLGRFIDGVSKDKTKEAITNLVEITPDKALKKVGEVFEEVTLDEIKKGDIIACKAGEKIAVDGEITSGSAHFDESFLTGESKPVRKALGDKVLAGSMNFDGYIEYRAERIGKESTVSEIVRLVVEATNTKAPIAKVADKVSGVFVPLVIAIAIITFVMYFSITKSFEDALVTFVTILVVACPCSLGLATPLAIVVSEGLCAANGILIKKSEVLENMGKADTIVFDKTGTLTYGKLRIAEVINYSDYTDEELLEIASNVEKNSNHPIGNAFSEYMKEKRVEIRKVENFENLAGLGVKATVDSTEVLLGNAKLVSKFKIKNDHLDDERILARSGCSIVYVIVDKKIVTLIGINDVLRENAKEVIEALTKNGIETIMLTGDNEETARKIGEAIGIGRVISDVMPSEKAGVIEGLKKEGKFVVMCGDGINDSPALSCSDIGISVKSGTDIAMDSATVILTKDDLHSIVKLIAISKKTLRIIKGNLFWAFFYNCLMIPVAVGILKPVGISISPMIASVAMVFSSVTVILNTLCIKRVKM